MQRRVFPSLGLDWAFASVAKTLLGVCLFVMSARTVLPSRLPRSLTPKPLNDPCVRYIRMLLSDPRADTTSDRQTGLPVVSERPRWQVL